MEVKIANTAIVCLSPYSGGMEIDSIKLAKKLSFFANISMIVKKGFFIDEQRSDYLGFNDIKLQTISFSSSFSFSIISELRKIVKEQNIENVIFFGASELKSLYFSFLGLDINLIVRHGTTKSRPKKDWFHKLIYSNVNYHVSICEHLLNNVRFIIPFGKETKEKLIYSSFIFNDSKTNIIKKDKFTLCHVGRIAHGKGQVDAIKACEVLVQNNIDFEFNIIGGFDESYKEEFMSFLDNCKYKKNIKLIGFTKDVPSYLGNSDVFLFPSYGEGLSNAFLEALGQDIVCISYDNTSFPELKKLGLDFFIAKNKDIEDLQKVLFDVYTNNYKVENSRKIKELFSQEKEINTYLEVLK